MSKMGKAGIILASPKRRPRFTLIIPTLNSASRISGTIDSLNRQMDCDLELVIIDAGSQDPTIDFVRRGYCGSVKVYSVREYSMFEMANRGISLATGEYISILLPGDSYISAETLSMVGQAAQERDLPDLIYCGCLIREVDAEPRILLEPFDVASLRKGMLPTSIQSCWFSRASLKRLGKFDTNFRVAAGYELLCRMAVAGGFKVARLERIFVDLDRRSLPPSISVRRSFETHFILKRYFGWGAAIRYWAGQHPLHLIKLWWKTRDR